MSKKVTTEEFISRCVSKFGDKLDYSSVVYTRGFDDIHLFCNVCKKSFITTPSKLIASKYGCLHCAVDNVAKQNTKDLTGEEFGYLTANQRLGSNRQKESLWLCDCKCGNSVTVKYSNLISGNSKSCGCLKKEKSNNQKSKLDIEDVRKYLKNINLRLLDTKYKNNKTPLNLKCLTCGSVFKRSLDRTRNSNNPCQNCAPYVQYQHKVKYFYVFAIGDITKDKFIALKYGVTSRKPSIRFFELAENCKFDVLPIVILEGNEPHMIMELEDTIKSRFKGGYLTKDIMNQGHTETVDIKDMFEFWEIIKGYIDE